MTSSNAISNNMRPDGEASLPDSAQTLRMRAEKLLQLKMAQFPKSDKEPLSDSSQKMFFELCVHQIELEMQNEELLQAHQELDAMRARYFDLYDLAPVGYCTLNEQGLILQTNLMAATLLGVVRGALVNQQITNFIFRVDQDKYYLHHRQLIENGKPQSYDLKMVKNDGTQFLVNLKVSAAKDADGAPEHRLVLNDISERERNKEELERFADISAHHLMEPSRRLISFSQRLRASLAGRIDDPEAQTSLDFIEDQANRLRFLLRDIQLYLVADQPLGEALTVDMERIVHEVIKHLADRIQDAGATVTVVLPSSSPALIDWTRISNLFNILLSNALQYRRQDVPLEIRIDGQEIGNFLRYRVVDNGCGIPAEYRERVFKVFERLNPRAGSWGGPWVSGEGTGIGLSIVRRIVSSCGGRTWIEETPGGGTTVIVELLAGAKL